MAYVLVRIYSGSSERSPEEILRMVGQELRPQLTTPGCRRYTTFRLDDGRIGSTSLYDDKATADRGNEIAAKVVKDASFLRGYSLARTLRGEVIFAHEASELSGDLQGEIRIYQTSASADDLRAAFEQEALPILRDHQGLVRYTAIQLDGDPPGCAVLTAHRDRESATSLSSKAREARQRAGSKLKSVLAREPETVRGTITATYTT